MIGRDKHHLSPASGRALWENLPTTAFVCVDMARGAGGREVRALGPNVKGIFLGYCT